MVDYLLGIDIGGQVDNTALVLAQRTALPLTTQQEEGSGIPSYRLEVRSVEQVALKTLHAEVLDHVRTLAVHPYLRGRLWVVLDATGVGQPVLQRYQECPELAPITWSVVYTSGQKERQDNLEATVPKKDLVAACLVYAQSGLLGFDPSLPHANLLRRQLLEFTMKRTLSNNLVYESGKRKERDDLANALFLVCWLAGASEQQEGQGSQATFTPYAHASSPSLDSFGPLSQPASRWRPPR